MAAANCLVQETAHTFEVNPLRLLPTNNGKHGKGWKHFATHLPGISQRSSLSPAPSSPWLHGHPQQSLTSLGPTQIPQQKPTRTTRSTLNIPPFSIDHLLSQIFPAKKNTHHIFWVRFYFWNGFTLKKNKKQSLAPHPVRLPRASGCKPQDHGQFAAAPWRTGHWWYHLQPDSQGKVGRNGWKKWTKPTWLAKFWTQVSGLTTSWKVWKPQKWWFE